jgi:hypothetical protein
MFESALFQWIGSIIAGGGIGAAITYLVIVYSGLVDAVPLPHQEGSCCHQHGH